MKKEDLTAIGLADEAADAVLKAVEKEQKSLNTKIKNLEGDLENANSKLNEKKEIDVEKIKNEAFDAGKAEIQKEFDEYKNNLLIDAEIQKTGAKDTKILRGLIDMEKVEISDGKVSGLSEQIEAIKAEKDYLFDSGDNKPSFVEKAGGGSDITREQFAKMSYKEKLDLFNTNQELYATLSE